MSMTQQQQKTSILSDAKFITNCELNLETFIYFYTSEGICWSLYESTKVMHCTAQRKDRLSSALMCSFLDSLLSCCDAQSEFCVTDSVTFGD